MWWGKHGLNEIYNYQVIISNFYATNTFRCDWVTLKKQQKTPPFNTCDGNKCQPLREAFALFAWLTSLGSIRSENKLPIIVINHLVQI